MSLDLWYSEEPCEPKYLQISHQGIGKFCKKNKINFDDFRERIHDHHAQPVTKDGMFILEQFFGESVLHVVRQYLVSLGYEINEDYDSEDGGCMMKGYDGILVSWSW